MKHFLSVLFSFLLVGLVGCASGGGTQKPTVIAESQQLKKVIIERVPNTDSPKWTAKGDFTENSKVFVVGFVQGFTNLQSSRIAAGNSAKTRFAQLIKDTFSARTASAIKSGHGDDETGGVVEEAFFSATDKLDVDGIMLDEYYSEQVQEQNGSASKIYWRSYCLASLTESKYKDAVDRAFDDTKKQLRKEKQSKNNKAAEELLEEVKNKFYND